MKKFEKDLKRKFEEATPDLELGEYCLRPTLLSAYSNKRRSIGKMPKIGLLAASAAALVLAVGLGVGIPLANSGGNGEMASSLVQMESRLFEQGHYSLKPKGGIGVRKAIFDGASFTLTAIDSTKEIEGKKGIITFKEKETGILYAIHFLTGFLSTIEPGRGIDIGDGQIYGFFEHEGVIYLIDFASLAKPNSPTTITMNLDYGNGNEQAEFVKTSD